MTNTGVQIKNNQSETAIIYVGYVLLLISSLVSARFAYLQQSNAILGVFFAIGMMGINMSVPYLIRWAIVSKRERRFFPMLIALVGIYWITSYSLSASSTLFTAGLQQNENLVMADRLAFDAQNDLVKQTNLEYSEMKKRGGFNEAQFAQQKIRMNMAGYQSKMKQSEILRNGTLDLKPKFLVWSIDKQTIAMFMALALEFAIIGIISFKEAVLTPTPLSGILRYVDQWLAPDVRVEDAVLKNPLGGGDANNIGMINETVTKKELKLRKKTNKALPSSTLNSGTEITRPAFGFVDTNNVPASEKASPSERQNELDLGVSPTPRKGVLNVKEDKSSSDSEDTPESRILLREDKSYKTSLKSGDDSSSKIANNDSGMSEGEGKYNLLQARLRVAETGGVGTVIECVNCGTKITKNHYKQKFCSHSRKPRSDGRAIALKIA